MKRLEDERFHIPPLYVPLSNACISVLLLCLNAPEVLERGLLELLPQVNEWQNYALAYAESPHYQDCLLWRIFLE